VSTLLSDAERDAIAGAALPLPPSQPAAFEQMVTVELTRLTPAQRGPGSLHRLIAAAQAKFLIDGPVAFGTGGKYGRPHAFRR
jgi:hypothetical protein